MAMSVRAGLDLLPGSHPCGLELLLLSGYAEDGRPRGVVPRWSSQEMLEEMIGDRHYALTLEFFQDKFTELGFIQTTQAANQHFSI
jgi:hypothetical protein